MIKIIFYLANLPDLNSVLCSSLLQIPMADTFRSEGKIYVVLAVMLILLAGLLFYLFRIDKKLKRLEDEWPEQKDTE